MGRPTKLTPELQDRIVNAVANGNYYEPACRLAGISYQTMRNWITRGEQAKSGIYFEFVDALTRAEAACEAALVAKWQASMPDDWRAISEFLARRYNSRWARRDKHELTGDEGGQIQIKVVYDN